MSAALGIVLDLLKALVGFLAGRAWDRLSRWFRTRHARHFWHPFVEGDLLVVVGRFTEFSSFEQSGFLGVGDAMALGELRAFLRTIGLDDFAVEFADRLQGDDLKKNLVLLGGPDANLVSREVVGRLTSGLRFGDPRLHEISIRDEITGAIYGPRKRADEQGTIANDYGVVLRADNPFARDRALLLVAGSFGFGTWAGVRLVTSKRFLDSPEVLAGPPLECLLETEVVRNTPQEIRTLVLRPIAAVQASVTDRRHA